MAWRYGITVRKLSGGEDWYEIRELYQDEGGKAYNSWTENPVSANGDSRTEVIEVLEMMLADAKKFKAKRIPPAPKESV